MDTVEVWHHDHCSGVFDREELRSWLAHPFKPLVVDEVSFSLDRMVDNEGLVSLSLPDVMAWTRSPPAWQRGSVDRRHSPVPGRPDAGSRGGDGIGAVAVDLARSRRADDSVGGPGGRRR
jgi:hypothetical protein